MFPSCCFPSSFKNQSFRLPEFNRDRLKSSYSSIKCYLNTHKQHQYKRVRITAKKNNKVKQAHFNKVPKLQELLDKGSFLCFLKEMTQGDSKEDLDGPTVILQM